MVKTLQLLKNKIKSVDLTEVFATLSIFVGIPVVISLYLDYRAGLLFFFSAGAILGLLAVRNK